MISPSEQNFDALGIGVCAIDYVFSVGRFPSVDEKCSSEDLTIQAGGAASNIIWAAARLGLRCSLIAKVGCDTNGDLALAELTRAGIDTSGVEREPKGRTPITAIVVDTSSLSRTCIHNNTGITLLDPEHLNLDLCRRTRLLVSDSWFPLASCRCAALTREYGGLVVVSIEHVNEEVAQLCSMANVVTTSISLVNRCAAHANLEKALKEFAAILGTDTLVATRGDQGCLLLSKGAVRSIPGTKINAVDTTGAGDAFTAGLCYGLLSDWQIEKACAFANLVGASACAGKGARPATLLRVVDKR